MTGRETPEGGNTTPVPEESDSKYVNVGTIGNADEGHTTLAPTILPVAIPTAEDRLNAALQQSHKIGEDRDLGGDTPPPMERERGIQPVSQGPAALGRELEGLTKQITEALGKEEDWIVRRSSPTNLGSTKR